MSVICRALALTLSPPRWKALVFSFEGAGTSMKAAPTTKMASVFFENGASRRLAPALSDVGRVGSHRGLPARLLPAAGCALQDLERSFRAPRRCDRRGSA
jgi:hypothetical protein